jgi:hypothetical protein
MRVKTQHFLQPAIADAHSVIVENAAGQPIFIAIEGDGGSVIAAQAGDPDFAGMLKMLGVEKTTMVYNIKPKSIEEMKALF